MTYALPSRSSDAGPDERALECKPEEKDWRDLAFDAGRSVLNAQRCDEHRYRRMNLEIAREQIDAALRLLA